MIKDVIRKLITKHLEYGQVNKLSRQSYADDDRISGSMLLKVEELIEDALITEKAITERFADLEECFRYVAERGKI